MNPFVQRVMRLVPPRQGGIDAVRDQDPAHQ
jgi:hypothetical protein